MSPSTGFADPSLAEAQTLVGGGSGTLDMAAMSSAQTLLADPSDTAVTLGAPSSAACTASLPTPSAASRHSTVLPRVEVVGGAEPRLIQNQRERYEHLGQLGEGGMGEVLKAQDNDIGRTVAIKRLKREVRLPAVVVRFMEEIRTIGSLEHPNIIPIHDVGVDEQGEYFFVMKYFDGETLESIIEKLAAGDPTYHAMYPFERRVELFEGVLEALHYAHANGVIHRDIKPANIMVGRFGEVMVMDWGVARRIRDDQPGPQPAELFPHRSTPPPRQVASSRNAELFRTREGALIGTPAYMSPEQARGAPLDERSDIYSLCVLFHELLQLAHYLEDKRSLPEMLEAVQSRPVPKRLGLKHPAQAVVPADLVWFIDAGISKDPAGRFPSVAAMLARLRRRREGDIPIQCQITFAYRLSNILGRFILRHPMMVTLGMAATLLLLVGFAVSALR